MSDGIKNNEWVKTIFSYLDQKMTDKERYDFERTLELDPFLAEAFEGMSDLKSVEIEKDLRQINFIKGKKTKHLSLAVYLIVALLFFGLLVVVILMQLPKKQPIEANSTPEKTIFSEQADSIQLQEDAGYNFLFSTDSSSTLVTEKNVIDSELDKLSPKIATEVTKNGIKATDKQQNTTSISKNEITTLPLIKAEVKNDAASPDQTLHQLTVISDKAGRNESDRETLSQQTIVVPQIEEVVGAEESLTRRIGANADPQPLGGNELFRVYLENSTRYPADIENPKRETLRIQFKISVTGDPKDFTVSRASLNDAFSREAIRLIKEGPRWSPAIQDGIPVEAEVSLRVVFKP